MKRLLFVPLVLLLGGCLLSTGCRSHGSRVVEVEILGQRIVVRDTVALDSEGKTDYWVGFDENSNLLKQMFGWMFPAKSEEPSE
ncbi:MAG: hypothetical protein KAV00_01870 [Phycisphaerae bacterium]|nr:hypothetical protein [Phycisphaerae bacterium]